MQQLYIYVLLNVALYAKNILTFTNTNRIITLSHRMRLIKGEDRVRERKQAERKDS